jgi:hypothetical protein
MRPRPFVYWYSLHSRADHVSSRNSCEHFLNVTPGCGTLFLRSTIKGIREPRFGRPSSATQQRIDNLAQQFSEESTRPILTWGHGVSLSRPSTRRLYLGLCYSLESRRALASDHSTRPEVLQSDTDRIAGLSIFRH